jgi:two-component system, chemotaxis family, chemotaxis protein CheY
MQRMDQNVSLLMRLIKVLIVDDRHLMRKVVRALLASIGARQIYEAGDGVSGLDAICTVVPHVVLLDWDMPGMTGAEFVRKVRSPATFSQPDVPIIILTGHNERSCFIEAERLGVQEYLLKPVSGQTLLSCILSVVAKPRPFVQIGNYYGPDPRNPPSSNRSNAPSDNIVSMT